MSVMERNSLHNPSAVSMNRNEEGHGAYETRKQGPMSVLSFGSENSDNPTNWSKRKKLFVKVTGILNVLNSTLGISLPTGAMPAIAKEFKVHSKTQLALPISIYLIGYAVGPIICGPLSERYGRKPVTLSAFMSFMAFMCGCAVCQNWVSLLVLRFFLGLVASAPVAIIGGLFADICDDPRERGRVIAYYMTVATIAPFASPLIAGYVSEISWRWTFWFGLILAGVVLPFVALVPETYAPILLKRKAKKLRKETGDENIVAPFDLEKRGLKAILTVTLARPIRMLVNEWIVLFTCLYLGLVYAIFCLFFQAYPAIFQGIYKMPPKKAGLAYLFVNVGFVAGLGLLLLWDHILYTAKARGAKWSKVEEYARLPPACIGGPLFVLSLLWLGWTSKPAMHWIVPASSGIIFGIGHTLILPGMLNYMSDAYETFSASAHSASASTRSLLGAGLPVAVISMFDVLGVNWSCSLLAFLSLAMSTIPFAFIWFGSRIRANSKFCQHLKRLKEQEKQGSNDRTNGIQTQSVAVV